MGYMAAIGGLMDIAGTALNAGEADARKKKLEGIANTPGLDFGTLTGEALRGYEQNLGAASALAGKVGTANQAQLLGMEEQALPGIGQARQAALGNVMGLFGDDAAWLKGVQRRGAALGLSMGVGGSMAGQMRTLKLSDTEGQQRTQLGVGLLGSLIGGMRMANTPGVQTFLGPTIQEQVAQRGQERAQRMSMLSGATMLPTGLETWGNRLQEVGSSMMGMGMMGMGGGGAGATAGGGWNTPFYNWGDEGVVQKYGLG